MTMKQNYKLSGFTLIEIAVVLVIVGLMLGGLLVPLTAQIEQRNNSETLNGLEEIKEALIGLAMSHDAADGHPYLPCPDTDGDGFENRAANLCSNVEGDVPWADLGLPGRDGWNNRYRYRVTQLFADSNVGFSLISAGNITIRDASGGNVVASLVPAAIWSKGGTGAGAGADETENSNADPTFVSHAPTQTAGNAFDDVVVWLPSAILFSRMVSAGQLP